MANYVSHSHSYGESYLHLQFTPKRRKSPFKNITVLDVCRRQFVAKATELGVILVVAEFGPEHCHLFLENWKNYTIPQLAQFFKGASSHALREQFPWLLSAVNKKSFWSDGYFYETVGSVTAEARRFYIERCQNKHWQNMDYPDWSKSQTQLTKWVN
jgi:putative transposase